MSLPASLATVSTWTRRSSAASLSRPRCSRMLASSAPSSRSTSAGCRLVSLSDELSKGSANRSGAGAARITGSRCSASPASAVRPLARRSDSAIRRAARAASTEPPQTSGVVSASAMASVLAGFTARSRYGEHAIATSSRAWATDSGSAAGPRSSRSSSCSMTTAVASWSPEEHGSTVLSRPAACSATSDPGGQATTTRQPRRTASATAEAAPVSPPSGASTTTRSRPPAQPGSDGPGHATNGTGHHGSSTARSSLESGPAATTARGRVSPAPSATAASIASAPPRRSLDAPASPPRRARRSMPSAASAPRRRRAGSRRRPRSWQDHQVWGFSGLRASSTSSTGMSSRTG